MVQNLSRPDVSHQVLQDVLKQHFSPEEIHHLHQHIEIVELTARKEFWRSQNADPGIYIIIAGKVRLTDSHKNSLGLLEAGESFGELTLFPTETFSDYSVRTAKDTATVGFLSGEFIQKLNRRYPQILEHIHDRAVLRESQLTGLNVPVPVVQKLQPSTEPKKPQKIASAYFPSPTLKAGHWWQHITHRYPFFAQHSAADCGAACLLMIASYWGKRFSINHLREIANVDRNGASLKGLSAAAESVGFSTRPVKASLNELGKQPLPAIAHWEGKHYIVVYEVTSKHVVIADPAIGQKTLTHAQFKTGWTGYALLLQPTTQLQQTKESNTPFWDFFELIKPHWLVLLEVLIASVFIQIFGLVTPLFTQWILDEVVRHRSETTLTAVGIGLLIFGLFRVAMTALRQYLLDHTANKVDLALIVGFITHTFRLPLSFFESRYVGDIISRMQENGKIQRFLTGEALSILLDFFTVFIYGGLMFWYSWKLALLVLLIIPPYFLLAVIATPFLQRVSREIFEASSAQNAYIIQALTGIQTVKSLAIDQTVRWHWEELLNKSVKRIFSGQLISNRLQTFSATIETVLTTSLLWFGAWQVIYGELSAGQLVAFNMLLGNVMHPFQRMTVLWNELQEVLISIERIHDVIEAEPEEDLHSSPRLCLPLLEGNIRFDNVTFRYHPESDINVLENLSFEIRPGQTVALVVPILRLKLEPSVLNL